MEKPRIVIPEIYQDVTNYTRAMQAAGIEPVVVSVQSAQILHAVQKEYMDYRNVRTHAYDGLILPGGADIDPERYGERNQGSHPARPCVDALQFRMLEDFIRLKKPVLGICRGMQLINVAFGGSLIQNLDTAFRHAKNAGDPDKIHCCHAEKNSWLAGIYGEKFSHNSAHHQAVCRLAEGFVIDSRCPDDGVTEAFHHASLPVYGVQWHPERTCLSYERPETVNGLEIFCYFRDICLDQRRSAAAGGRAAASEDPDLSTAMAF